MKKIIIGMILTCIILLGSVNVFADPIAVPSGNETLARSTTVITSNWPGFDED